MAVLAQVHVADLNYLSALKQYNRANELYKIDERLSQQISKRQESDIQSMLERISQETAAIESVMRRYQTYSEVVAAVGRLHSTLGLGNVRAGVHSNRLKDLTNYLGLVLQARMSGVSLEEKLNTLKKGTLHKKKTDIILAQNKQKKLTTDSQLLYPKIINFFQNVDVPEVKELKGYTKNLQAPLISSSFSRGLENVNQKILWGLGKIGKKIVPTLDAFSEEIITQVKSKKGADK
jgi:hypothetical protein